MLAIPAFMLAGDVMSKGGRTFQTSRCLCRFPRRLDLRWNLPWYPSLPAHSLQQFPVPSVATTAAIGGLMYPEMVKRGYPESYAAAVQAIGGTLGIVIPPSIVPRYLR